MNSGGTGLQGGGNAGLPGKNDGEWEPETFGFAWKLALGVLGAAVLAGIVRDLLL